jgi:excinuclease ABC subunit A
MPDIWTTCHYCRGKRYKKEILDIHYHGCSISDVLEMDVSEALSVFANEPEIKTILQMLSDVGLSYIKLGQSALTLSGGEAARIKMAKELSGFNGNHNVYILDEPTTGLHFKDIEHLVSILQRIVCQENTVIAIEHNLDLISMCDWIIDMGPEGGDEGGYIIAEGTPEDISKNPVSVTGQLLTKRF